MFSFFWKTGGVFLDFVELFVVFVVFRKVGLLEWFIGFGILTCFLGVFD